jgi:membrane protease YdiL (CAAX protease family)
MAVLSWVVAPRLADVLPGGSPLVQALLLTLTGGLIWQFVLVLVLVRREQGSLSWPVLRDALWLRSPRSPRTGRCGGWVWLALVPFVVGFGLVQLLPEFPPTPVSRDFGGFLESDAGAAFLSGHWEWFAVIVVLALFNTVLGEELLFRGLLLPRMSGRFGRWDWLANGVLFACYHLHMPWAIPVSLFDSVLLAYPSRRYRSALMGIAVHSAQSVVIVAGALVLVLR